MSDDVLTQQDAAQEKPKKKASVANFKMIPSNVLAWRTVYSRDYFQPPEYNLMEVGRAEDTEAYVRQANRKKVGLMFKSGWQLNGSNDATVAYVRERLAQIEQACGQPLDVLLQEVGYDFIKYHNAYLVKVRSQRASGGRRRYDGRWSRTLDPVAAYFRMSPETVWVRRDIFGNVLQYRQQVMGGVKRAFFDPWDVIHFYQDRKGGLAVGTPALIPVLDDIRALRRLEENIELLVYQHLFPLLHYQVGTDNAPAEVYPDGTSEVDIVRQQLQRMPAEGCIVTPERHQINLIGAGGRALRADWYLEHFKHRLWAGLEMSGVDFGEGAGANRSTAERLSRALVDCVKAYQRTFAAFVNHEIIRELLLESTWGEEALLPQNLVYFSFAEVDQDAKIKHEASVINLYHGHLIDESEARASLGLQPVTEEQRPRMYFDLVEKQRAIIQALDEPYSTRSTSAPERYQQVKPTSGNAYVPSPQQAPAPEPSSRQAKNITQPTNQHGTKTGPERRLSSQEPEPFWLATEVLHTHDNYMKGVLQHDSLPPVEHLQARLFPVVLASLQEAAATTGTLTPELSQQLSQLTEAYLRHVLTQHRRLAEAHCQSPAARQEDILFSLRRRWQNGLTFLYRRACLLGELQALREAGVQMVRLTGGEHPQCRMHQGRLLSLETDGSRYWPPHHPQCTCRLEPV